MAYKVPSDEEVVAAITRVLGSHGTVRSQRRLRELVQDSLRRIEPEYRASQARIRQLAVASGFARLEIRARKDPPRAAPKACPVCAGPLRRIKNRTLENRVVSFELKCRKCGYFTGIHARVPTRYIFHKRS